ncbi:mediator of RNA polymerase II transcription subunit 27 isoform X4 [Mustela putorius furo]|uniref:Mediator of RNA polymerase II transcription subunit 27 n=1 Tax=Mustela putorius furo TaxID=9669 RepID=A0A8U0TEQ6_MUSPF|nr:mediator of RNA polymerase II transcription subunit 27 isoform X4 [Mustela putorius furo]
MADLLSVGVNLEAFAQAISAIQALRSSVSRVFDCLKDGMRNKETLEGREKAFIAHFQDNLHSVNRDLNELERLSNLVGKPSENHPLHNSGLLSLDPVQDKTPLYSQLLQAYKWSNKILLESEVEERTARDVWASISVLGQAAAALPQRYTYSVP